MIDAFTSADLVNPKGPGGALLRSGVSKFFPGVPIPAGLVFQEGKFDIPQIGRDAPVKEVDVGGSLACAEHVRLVLCNRLILVRPWCNYQIVNLRFFFFGAFACFFFGAFVFFFLRASLGSSNCPATHALHRGSESGMPLKGSPH